MSASRINRAGATVEARVGVTRTWKPVPDIGNIDDRSSEGRGEDTTRRTVGARYTVGMPDGKVI